MKNADHLLTRILAYPRHAEATPTAAYPAPALYVSARQDTLEIRLQEAAVPSAQSTLTALKTRLAPT